MPAADDDFLLRRLAPPSHDFESVRARRAVAERLFGQRELPVRVGRYEVQRQLGAGGMGMVYEAYDPDLDRTVAIKLIQGAGRPGVEPAPEARARLLREARAMARLSHPNVIAVYDVGVVDRTVFVAMELVDGRDLRKVLGEAAPGWEKVVDLFRQAAAGLAAAHEAGLVHRDFKPENVLVGGDGRVRVSDFGLAGGVVPRSGSGLSRLGDLEIEDLSLTQSGALLGTPKYMAPEQFRDPAQAGPAADQFSFCVALYEALYGCLPFDGTTLSAYRAAVDAGRVRLPPEDSDVPEEVFEVLRRGLSAEPDARHRSMHALGEALERAAAAPRRRKRRKRRLLLGAVALGTSGASLALVLFALAWTGPRTSGAAKETVAPPPEAGPADPAVPPALPAPPGTRGPERGAPPSGRTGGPIEVENEAAAGDPPEGPSTASGSAPSAATPRRTAGAASIAAPSTAQRPFAACYYNDRNKLLAKRRRHRRQGRLDDGGCYECRQRISGRLLSGLRDAGACNRHYRCVPLPAEACAD